MALALHSAIGNKNPRFCYHHDEMNRAPSIGVVLPTLNCAHLLPDHLASMQPWLDLVEQIVVVDSHSEDGSSEMLQKRLAGHPRVTFHQRPRGLYQSWNFGISQLNTEYTYISTVGDFITRPGLEHLVGVANDLRADVVVSKPNFIEEDGSPSPVCIHWPVDDIVGVLEVKEPTAIDEWTGLIFQIVDPVDAILGSSASNIYRTALLQSRPFPTEYGTVGDGAWGLANVLNYRLAVTPKKFSTFRHHVKSYGKAAYAVSNLNDRLYSLLTQSYRTALEKHQQLASRASLLGCEEMLNIVQCRMHWQKQLEKSRAMPVPWILNPLAWHARQMRNRLKTEAVARRTETLRLLSGLNG